MRCPRCGNELKEVSVLFDIKRCKKLNKIIENRKELTPPFLGYKCIAECGYLTKPQPTL